MLINDVKKYVLMEPSAQKNPCKKGENSRFCSGMKFIGIIVVIFEQRSEQ
jgi:hypothetical protein